MLRLFPHTYQSFIPIPDFFFFSTDLTDGCAPRFEKVSLETKYNIVVGTQTALKSRLLDGLHKLTPEQDELTEGFLLQEGTEYILF